MIAEALEIEDDDRSLRFILSSLNTINAGQIQRAKVVESEEGRLILLVAEGGTNYKVYLTGNGSVDAVENMDTGEWPIQSIK